ncbi:UDP-N-acetylmuramoyl-L-alanine--D-glutamate ligase [Tepidimicrobium xylanilyticum]|uniref:UDP-N-acetylmuramoylalanine--D-glutamate ligase n=1 Tax=Tepidimicrobium xylanilyticum TaxID=1123352 RepID=A0A1H2SSA1_9FIRM|nr:UDP-N-acetylmuramoyl-L-alanine--D-glutamate ligase [Tepidimicrobium xylanilyticum]GMG96147.1 UDP-N-acetylmuramoylalanine--D-glutamate ligase [Tepidimicrobium xylanilyticum]SDW33924.1 UDP-N-acetylmuramoylalanine--D-glutamate ligase [Tepidimicrobium xylanilyticum]
MEFKDKNILILGLGISGISTAKALYKLGARITVSDLRKEDELKENISQIEGLNIDLLLGTNDVPLDDIDLIVKSPGIPLNIDILKKAYKKNIQVVTDLELAYKINPNANLIVITGTNGKTTTTTLVGEFFKKAGYTTHVVGNIGVGLLWNLVNSNEEDIFVIEASSFQLENTMDFKPKVSLILNITPDHLNWHNTLENYIKAKKKVFINQGKNEFTILNYDDQLLRKMEGEVKSNLIWFSVDNILTKGVYTQDDYIVINDGVKTHKVIKSEDVKILGKHNLENALGAVAIGWIMGLDVDIMKEVLSEFPGVEHRIEYVTTIKGVNFYNDSKGTNPDASTKAIEAIKPPIILIAGGQDKGSDFEDFILAFNDKVKTLILLGETKEKIKNTALKLGFNNIYIVNNMEEAVNKSFEVSESGDNVLLSPACASWDMYSSFEMRGEDFKRAVYRLKEE